MLVHTLLDLVAVNVRFSTQYRRVSAADTTVGSPSTNTKKLDESNSQASSPLPGIHSPVTSLPTNRISKSKFRKNSNSVTPSTVQRAFEGDPSVLAQHMIQRSDTAASTNFSETSSNVPSLASSSSSTPQTEAVDVGSRSSKVDAQGDPKDEEPSRPLQASMPNVRSGRLQLGMLGLGGYRTESSEAGWEGGEWPEYNSILPPRDHVMAERPRASCCAPPQPEKQPAAPSSCCAPKTSHPTSRQSMQAMPQFPSNLPGFHDSRGIMPPNMDLNFGDQFNLPEPTFSPTQRQIALNFFGQSEDQFGCNHDPNHSCECGDGCECLGCSVHPANRATTDYVRYHTELAYGRYMDPNRLQMPPPGFGQHAPFSGDHNNPSLRNMHQPMIPENSPYTHPSYEQPPYAQHWQTGHPPLRTPTLEMQHFNLQTSMASLQSHASGHVNVQPPRTPITQQSSSSQGGPRYPVRQMSIQDPSAYDHESPSTEDDASTLSPSAFSVQQFNMPGCNDVTGSCLCGDGCQCEGCVTHSGHGNKASDERIAEVLRAGSSVTQRGADLGGLSNSDFDDILREPLFPTTVPG